MQLLLCNCPEVPFDLAAVTRQLADAGLKVHLTPPMCTPAGLKEASTLAKKPGPWLLDRKSVV